MSLQKQILEYLYIHTNPASSKDISEAIGGNKADINADLHDLRGMSFVLSSGGPRHSITDKGRNFCVLNYGLDESDIEEAKQLDDVEINENKVDSTEVEIADSVDLIAAFERLSSQLSSKKVVELHLKISVLERLSKLMDASIANVLNDIAEDLIASVK